MKLMGALILLVLAPVGGAAAAQSVPLSNPALLNIGFVCKWQERCIQRQRKAMQRSLSYVRKHKPPAWKVQLCNRNASRRRGRVDWIGHYNCIRNPKLVRPARYRR